MHTELTVIAGDQESYKISAPVAKLLSGLNLHQITKARQISNTHINT